MNLGEMRQELYALFGHDDNPDVRVINRFDGWINSVYKELLAEKGFSALRNATLTFESIANQAHVVLPQVISKVRVITDRAHSHPLSEASIHSVRYQDPANTGTGSYPTYYVPIDLAAATAIDPVVGANLYVKSTSTLDGTGQRVYLECIRDGGYRRRVSVTMNGTTAVDLDFSGALTNVQRILKFYLATPAAGDITLHQTTSSGLEIARIPFGRQYARYSRILLHPTPTAAITYHADVELSINALEVDADEPIFHPDFDFLLPCGAAKREYLKLGKMDHYDREHQRWRNGIGNLKARLAQPSGLPSSQPPRRSPLSAFDLPVS